VRKQDSLCVYVFTYWGFLSQKYKFYYDVPDPYSWQENAIAKLGWEAGQKPVKGLITLKHAYVPVPYIRLIDQLHNEALHAKYNQGHEAQRRGSYAERTLDKFGEEVEGARQIEHPGHHASAWRSKVLTPILQRQLQGVSDAYWPSIHAGVLDPEDGSNNPDRKMTIAAATKFYLSRDPIPPWTIPSYLRNLIYVREMRWHLKILLGKASVKDAKWFDQTLAYHDFLLCDPKFISQELEEGPPGSIPLFSPQEISSLESQELEEYFKQKLVGALFPPVASLIFTFRSLKLLKFPPCSSKS
jgi:hypothetical protein